MAVSGTGTACYTFSASNDAVTGVYVVSSLRWVGATAAGQNCRITNTAGTVVFVGEADGANFTDGWVFDGMWMNGITVASMNSGSLQVYLSPR